MTDRPKGLLRGVGVLAAVLLAAGAISPAFSAFTPTKAKIKKIATKVLKNKIGDFGNPNFIQETELHRWGPIELNVGGADQTIGTFGPFTLKAQCLDSDATADTDIEIRVGVTTTENNSALYMYYGTLEDDLDVGEDGDWFDEPEPDEGFNDPGDPQHFYSYGDGFAEVAAPSGASLWGKTDGISNFAGSHCWLKGFVLVNG